MKNTLLLILLCLFGCGIFKKTSKTSSTATQSSNNQLESTQLVLKNADKETQLFTYWNDSGFYQVQYIKEQVDQVDAAYQNKKEEQSTRNELSTKKVEPVKTWLYVGGILVVIGLFFVYFKIFRYRS